MRFIWHLCIPGSSLNHDRQQESRVRFSSTSALFSQIALELHIRMAVFINLGWTKNFDHRPQTFCHPSGSSCQSVQSSYSVCFSRGFGGQREDQPGCLFLHSRPHPTHPSSHVHPTKGQQEMSAMTVFSEEVLQLCRWKTWRKMCYARRCDRAVPAAPGQEQNSYTSKRELDRKYFMETQGFCPHPKGFRKITRMLTER